MRKVKTRYGRKELRRRSQRFRVEFPALLWVKGSNRARATRTRTKDISRTGLYLHGEFPQQLGSTILFEVQIPPLLVGGAGGLLRGQGTLVRYEVLESKRIGFAAKINRYEFLPTTKAYLKKDPEAA